MQRMKRFLPAGLLLAAAACRAGGPANADLERETAESRALVAATANVLRAQDEAKAAGKPLPPLRGVSPEAEPPQRAEHQPHTHP